MAKIYLTPEDISTSDTLLVLAFLNTVAGAEEIAARIEIPNELDIGVNLGIRILDAREAYGGQYSTLEQLMAVPLIGPERFTEIITVLTGKSAQNIVLAEVNHAGAAQMLALSTQFNQLKQAMDSAEALDSRRYRIELEALESQPYLGEVVSFKLKVIDRFRNVSKVNMPLTIETNWGKLQYTRAYHKSYGTVLNVRTGVDGSAIFQLHTPTIEPLSISQQTELSNALVKLNDGAELPNDAREDFVNLSELYQHPLNRNLRDAIDIHYKSRQQRLVDTLNRADSLYNWVYEQALIRVYLHPTDEHESSGDSSTVLTMAALTVEYRDWLVPWYQIYKENLLKTSPLPVALKASLNSNQDETKLASQMISNIQVFISTQQGLIGERAGQQIGQEVVTRLMADNLPQLSHDTRATLYTLVNQAPELIKANGKGAISMAKLPVEKNTLLEEQVSQLLEKTDHINFDQLVSNIASFENNYSTFEGQYTVFSDNYSNFNTNLTSFDTQYTTFNRDYSDFESRRTETLIVNPGAINLPPGD